MWICLKRHVPIVFIAISELLASLPPSRKEFTVPPLASEASYFSDVDAMCCCEM